MNMSRVLLASVIALVLAAPGFAQTSDKPRTPVKAYTPGRTPWGDPDLQGTFTNKDENGIPLERPGQFEGRAIDDVSGNELATLVKQRNQASESQAAGIGGAETGAGPIHWYEYYGAKNSRPWLLTEPADGRIPPTTPEAKARLAAITSQYQTHGEADAAEIRSLYDRCITRGVIGSILPVIYNNGNEIVQAPGYVVLRNEMIHEARVIPLDGRPHLSSGVRSYLGDSRGHWDGNTLVVETTNFTDRTGIGPNGGGARHSEALTIVERFTMADANTLLYEATIDDPHTWTRPWKIAFPWKRDTGPNYSMFEYACHEGNYALRNILSGARAEEKRTAK